MKILLNFRNRNWDDFCTLKNSVTDFFYIFASTHIYGVASLPLTHSCSCVVFTNHFIISFLSFPLINFCRSVIYNQANLFLCYKCYSLCLSKCILGSLQVSFVNLAKAESCMKALLYCHPCIEANIYLPIQP